MKRYVTVVLALILVLAFAVPVSAAADSGWIELLEYSAIQANGENWFTMSGTSGSVSISVQGEKRLRKVDILLWNPTGQRPSAASCSVGSKTTNLEVFAIGANLTRIVGYLPDSFYETIRIDLKKNTTSSQTYEVLSWKVTPVGVQEFLCDASVYMKSFGVSGTYGVPYDIPLYFDGSESGSDGADYIARIDVLDWEKYDSLSIWGSVTSASIESIRASIDTTALDYVVNFIDAEAYEFAVDGDPTYWVTSEWGKYLFNITIDLSGVDRSLTQSPLLVYITGSYDLTVQAYFNCQYVNGSVTTADTSNVSWWYRFTTFMTSLFSPADSDAEDFGSSMESQAGAMEDAVDELDQVTKPDVDDLDISLDEYIDGDGMAPVNGVLTAIFSHDMVVTMLIITLTCAFASYALFGKR